MAEDFHPPGRTLTHPAAAVPGPQLGQHMTGSRIVVKPAGPDRFRVEFVERESEINAFQPVEYWNIGARLNAAGTQFGAKFTGIDGQVARVANGSDKEGKEQFISGALANGELTDPRKVQDVPQRETTLLCIPTDPAMSSADPPPSPHSAASPTGKRSSPSIFWAPGPPA